MVVFDYEGRVRELEILAGDAYGACTYVFSGVTFEKYSKNLLDSRVLQIGIAEEF